jgi:hypothetical protein
MSRARSQPTHDKRIEQFKLAKMYYIEAVRLYTILFGSDDKNLVEFNWHLMIIDMELSEE